MTKRAGLFEQVDAAGVRVFGDEITLTYHDLPAETGDGVWTAPGERIEVVDGVPVATVDPTIGLHLADWTRAPEDRDTITRAGVVYDVGEVVPDGEGGVTVQLVKPRPSYP